MSDNTSLGDRMKWYERRYTETVFLPSIPVMARIDGRAFHSFTHGLNRPYDEHLSMLMVATTKYLVGELNAQCGYTQSDEISLVWLTDSQMIFGGKLQKLSSIIASMTSVYFNKHLPFFLPNKKDESPVFDCRLWQVPTGMEAANCFIWREQDATRNSVQMAARAHFSHNECHCKDTSELQDMLMTKGINWNDYPRFFKRGTYVRRRSLERPFNAEELAALPEKHAARNTPDLVIRRTVVMEEDFPPLTRIANREEVILHGADPQLFEEVV